MSQIATSTSKNQRHACKNSSLYSQKKFDGIKIDKYWAFADKKRSDTSYITHGYHRYPAKFIPQLASALIKKYTKTGDLVIDPFCGCGTTLVEAKVTDRKSLGVDINPVAVLIAKAKITAIEPLKLLEEFDNLKRKIQSDNKRKQITIPKYERIDYWFKKPEKIALASILVQIYSIKNIGIRNFFLCAFSNILKNCSIWMQKSNKPTRDLNKNPSEPLKTFLKQVQAMLKSNALFYKLFKDKDLSKNESKVYCRDARKLPVKNNCVDLIVTSPPYVTSYEYADLHQLTALWLEYASNLKDFRKKFIGTSYNNKKNLKLNSRIAKCIIDKLNEKDKKTAHEVFNYFGEMNQVFVEMKRVLKKGAKVCIVIGNTSLKKVDILNAEVFTEQLLNLSFKIEKIIKREIPSKNLPSVRDEKTGQFAKITNGNRTYAYPTEYIVIMEKL